MIAGFDHVAVPMEAVDSMLEFYQKLGFEIQNDHGKLIYSVHFGNNKINFHTPKLWQSKKFDLRGPTAKPECGDFCFVWEGSQQALMDILANANAKVIEGPVNRKGGREGGNAIGNSVYVRDPDSNLLEFMIY